jgi:hypothetical protein
MGGLVDWLIENRAWLFDGALVAVPIAIIGWLVAKRAAGIKQRQRGGKNSLNIQAGGDVNMTSGGDSDGSKPKGRR